MQRRSGAASHGTVQREATMYRLLFLFCAVVVGCEAVQITEFASCGSGGELFADGFGAVINLPQQTSTPGGCEIPDRLIGFVRVDEGPPPIDITVVAVPISAPNDPCGGCDLPPDEVSASVSLVGNYALQPDVVPAFWSVCVTADDGYKGTGTRSVSGFVGPYTIGAACDFAHAVPFPSSGTVILPVNISASAAGNATVQIYGQPQFFDAGGTPSVDESFTFEALPTVPEPSTIIPAALALICFRLTRRRV